MKPQSLTQIIQQVYVNMQVVASFNQLKHIEFILVKNALNEYYLIWLPTTLDTCIIFRVRMNLDTFISQFQAVKHDTRITYLLENFINSSYHDIPSEHSHYLQTQINLQHGLHN